MWVKICANTNLGDAKLAAELGADAVGFVFAPSKRRVTAEQVAAIVPHLPRTLEKIGVFATCDANEIAQILRATGLTGVQLHGGFDVDLARRLRAELGDTVTGDSLTIIQTLHWVVGGGADNAEKVEAQLRAIANEPAIDRVLLDSKIGSAIGGSGISFDWSVARDALQGSESRLIVAGGLRPGNVADAIAELAPWGVDVASGIEAEPGRKDPEKLRRFIENAHRSHAEVTGSHPSR